MCCGFTFLLLHLIHGGADGLVLLPRAGGPHFPWWAGLVLGLGMALIIAIVLCALACCFALRWRKRERMSAASNSQRDVESAKVGAKISSGLQGSSGLRPGVHAVCQWHGWHGLLDCRHC